MPGVTWGDRVGIRPLRPGDAGALRRFVSDPDVAYLLFEELGGEPPSALLLGTMIFFQMLSSSPDFGIIERGGRLVGSVRLWRVSERNRSAMLTIFIGEKQAWNRGYGQDALRLALRHAFTNMGLHRVELNVFAFNERAIRCYERVGFVREGARREALFRDNRFHDILVMGVTRNEFLAREAERSTASVASEQ
ncbi:MAG: putative acetyltransferase [Symbiobacteriaceae bacterium]|nr:putative acetyltransferase [Symbiobacteriaceae bacterium]